MQVRNRLLASLSAAELKPLRGVLHPVDLKPRQVLHHSKMPMDDVYFIERGLVSVSARTAPDKWVEAWLIGSEGMTGIPVVLGDDEHAPLRRVVQIGGSALRISREDLRAAIEASKPLRTMLLRYVQAVLLQTSQSSACNATHDLKQRLSRWLLLASDALEQVDIPLTHQVLSRLLGVRRASVTECLGVLEQDRAVENHRGLIRINDPAKLGTLGCECHRLMKHEYERLIGRQAAPRIEPLTLA